MADQFCLRWNNFQSNIINALDSLKCSEDLVDVTLTCEGKNIKAHKVILSACSPYFRNVFKENPCQHPVIILKDVSADDIVSLLSYMYQGEVFIEESKLSSFLHTAALLQVKGLTGVTSQRESFSSPSTSNKLYTQLTISSKPQIGAHKDRLTGLKKRRSSTSDKPNDITIGNVQKKSKILESNDLYNNLPNLFKEVTSVNNNIEKKNDNVPVNEHILATTTEKNILQTNNNYSQSENIPLVKKERVDSVVEDEDPLPAVINPLVNSDNDSDGVPDYENSMLARSLLSGINPLKNDICANNNASKKAPAKMDSSPTSRPKDVNNDTVSNNNPVKSPSKVSSDELVVKSEKHSPRSDNDYEPEILLSEKNDGDDSDGYGPEQSQALLLLAGMSNVLGSGASTSGVPHQQSNHAAICGDCPHCGMKYSNQSALKYHVRLMHSDLTNRLCCYLCPRSFTMRETFKEHMWTTHGQRN